MCGKASIDAIRTKTRLRRGRPTTLRLPLEVLLALPDRLRAAQQVFDKTGGLHAAGLFTAAGELVALREDVGRHNAVDKVIGDGVREGRLPLAGHVLMVSGRASFELTQKAAMAGIPVLAAVSAPSSLAVELAREVGITLVGFLRGDGCNVYTRTGADQAAVDQPYTRQNGWPAGSVKTRKPFSCSLGTLVAPSASTADSDASTSSTRMSRCSCGGWSGSGQRGGV